MTQRPKLVTPARVRRHVTTTLSDTSLEQLINDANNAVVSHCGPHHIDGLIEETVRGDASKVFPSRAIQTVESVTEVVRGLHTALSDDDYAVWHGGRMLERMADGAHPRARWGDQVLLTYTPVDDDPQRRMAIIRLVQLGIQYEGIRSETVGPYSSQYLDYTRERDAILKQLCAVAPI